MGLPEVFYGNNHLYLANPEHNFLFEVSAVDAISFASYAKRQETLRTEEKNRVEMNCSGDSNGLNLIDSIPQKI
jgi:hypothetical protein